MTVFKFEDSWCFALLLLIPFAFLVRSRRPSPVFVVPYAAQWQSARKPMRCGFAIMLLTLAVVCNIIALARPQIVTTGREMVYESAEIMLVIDVSRSMDTEDFFSEKGRISRLAATKRWVEGFIMNRPVDRIGVVLFAGNAYTLSSPTLRKAILLKQLDQVKNSFDENGSAIGNGVALAVSRMEESQQARSNFTPKRFIVVISDGASNAGFYNLGEAVDLARKKQTAVYTIAVAGDGKIEKRNDDGSIVLVDAPAGGGADEFYLWNLSRGSNGKFYSCSNTEKLSAVLRDIDFVNSWRSFKTVRVNVKELYVYFVGAELVVVAALCFRALLIAPYRSR